MAAAQYPGPQGDGHYPGPEGPHAAPNFQSGVSVPFPGHVWIGGTAAGKGLGYQGSFATAAGLVPIWEDWFYGNWIVDGRGHVSEAGKPFGNLGLARRQLFGDFMLSAGAWYDYDGDEYDNFGHTFRQVGVTTEVMGIGWMMTVNGYFPVGDTDFSGGVLPPNQFLIAPGLDSALNGFDAEFGFNLPWFPKVQPTLNLAGYTYASELVDQFKGFSARLELNPLDAVNMQFQLSNDDQFGTTGFFSVSVHMGGSRRYNARDPVALLYPTQRNSHIVRVHQDPEFGMMPPPPPPPPPGTTSGRIIFVDNSAPPGGDGSEANPFDTLAEGDAAANMPGDVIIVRLGTGTTQGYDMGITLDPSQLLLGGDVGTQFVQLGDLPSPSALFGNRPVITNILGPNVVTLSNDNTVAGFNIVGGQFGIRGTGIVGANIFANRFGSLTSGSTVLFTAPVRDAVRIENGSGLFDVTNNEFAGACENGIHFLNTVGVANITDNLVGSVTPGSDTTDERTQANGVGANAGIRIGLDAAVAGAPSEFTANISGNTIQNNGFGIISQSFNAGAVVNTNITDNVTISDNGVDGINIRADLGSRQVTLIHWNMMVNDNGSPTDPFGSGRGIRLISENQDPASTNTTTLDATITNNTINGNAGSPNDISAGGSIDELTPPVEFVSGLFATVDGNANGQFFVADNNIINGRNGDGVRFSFHANALAVDGAGMRLVNRVIMLRNNISDNENDGVVFDGPLKRGVINFPFTIDPDILEQLDEDDLLIGGMGTDTISNPGIDGASVVDILMSENTILRNGDDGIELTVTGQEYTVNPATTISADPPPIVRFDFNKNDVSHNRRHGIIVTTFSDSTALGLIDANRIVANGGPQPNPGLEADVAPDYHEGIQAEAYGNSVLALRVNNNFIARNGLAGIGLFIANPFILRGEGVGRDEAPFVLGLDDPQPVFATVIAIITNNRLADNDVGNDPIEPIIEVPFEHDLIAVNNGSRIDATTTSRLCVALSTNFTSNGFVLNNNSDTDILGMQGIFECEIDGNTNAPTVPDEIGMITAVPWGDPVLSCQVAYANLETTLTPVFGP